MTRNGEVLHVPVTAKKLQAAMGDVELQIRYPVLGHTEKVFVVYRGAAATDPNIPGFSQGEHAFDATILFQIHANA
jgi:hypothetical protein